MKPLLRRAVLPLLALAALSLSVPAPSEGAEIAAFATGGKPGETWNTGFGGMLTITLFNIVHGEIEGAWQSSALPGTSIGTLAGKAYLGPSIGRFVPYVGLGAGVYRLSLPNGSDQGSLGSFFMGAKLKFPLGLVIRAEYQWLKLPQGTLLPLDQRFFVGAGLSF